MSVSKSQNVLEHFTRLSKSVQLLEPSSQVRASNEPDLILLVTWMDASLRHIAKYTTGYTALYPSTRILVVTTTLLNAISSPSTNLKRVAPALEILYALPPDTKVLLSLFSNGGAYTTSLILQEYMKHKGKVLPVSAVVFDSTPGRATYAITMRAMIVSLPKNAVLRLFGSIVLGLFLRVYQFACWVTRTRDVVELARAALNDKRFVNIAAPRLYAYSVADVMVPWESVEEHAQHAAASGYAVTKDKYQDSAHCGHLMAQPDRYWRLVQKLWGTAI